MILKIFHLLILITTIATSTTINYHFVFLPITLGQPPKLRHPQLYHHN